VVAMGRPDAVAVGDVECDAELRLLGTKDPY
jgi:hypothetical protein